MQDKKKTHLYYGLLGTLFIFSLFLHLYKLSELPFAVNIDEAGLWYNVQCLLNFGTDQANNSWPLLFANFHGEQSAMYNYLAFLCCKIFGNTLFSIRLPAALSSCLIFIFGYKIVNMLYKNKKINLLFCAFYTISPYFLMEARFALDCNLMLCFSTLFLYLFLKAINTGKISDAIYAGISCGLVLYTYGLSYITMPLFLLFSIIVLILSKKITWKQGLAFCVPLGILAMPLILIQIINMFDLQEIVIGNITLPKFGYSRHEEVYISNLPRQLIGPLIALIFTSDMMYEGMMAYSNFYWISVPFLLIGFVYNIVRIIKDKDKNIVRIVLLTWWLFVYFTACFVQLDCSVYHINALMFVSVVWIIDGLLTFLKLFKEKSTKILFISVLLIVYLVSTISFMGYYYYGSYNMDETKTRLVYEDLTDILNEINSEKTIYILIPSAIYRMNHPVSHTDYPLIYKHYEEVKGFEEEPILIENYYFDKLGHCLDNVQTDCTYIVPTKAKKFVEVLDTHYFTRTQMGTYYIYLPCSTTK